VRVAAEAAESANTIAVAVLTAAKLRIGVPESVPATRQPIAKPHLGYARIEMALEETAITGGANAAVAITFAGTDGSRRGVRESRFTSTTGTTTAIAAGFVAGRELREAHTGGADIANAVNGGEADSSRGPTAPAPRLAVSRLAS
jgi:hypothetical protein